MKRHDCIFWFLLLCCMMSNMAFGHDFEAVNDDGVTIYYNIISSTDKTVEVTYKDDDPKLFTDRYSGRISIPETVSFEGTTYTVMGVDESSFYRCNVKSVKIPNTVTTIGMGAFCECKSMTSMTIPEGVTSIGDYAFDECYGLQSVAIPNSVTSIGSCAFWDCRNLTTINIPETVTYIGKSAFENTRWYNLLPDGMVYLGQVAYCYKGSTPENASITLKDGILRVSERAFYDCYNLVSVTIPNSVIEIGEEAFFGCHNLTHVELPHSITVISNGTFSNCSSLPSIEIPNSVTSIDESAFSFCTSLSSVTIPNSVTTIGDIAFAYCMSLTHIEIPNSVTSIGALAFSGTGLASVEIPNSVNSIGEGAFDTSLLNSVTIPNSVITIGKFAFQDCKSLSEIHWRPNADTDLRQQLRDSNLIDASRTLFLYKDVDNAEMVSTIAATFEGQFKEIIIVDVAGIRGINDGDTISNPNAIYDLQGRRVDHPSKGIYIVNGKKVYIPR